MKKLHNSGQKLWSKATRIIPGGNGLLSKRPEISSLKCGQFIM